MATFPEMPKGLKIALFVIGAFVIIGSLGIYAYESLIMHTELTTKRLIGHAMFVVLGGLAMMPHRVLAVLEKLPSLKK